MRGLGNSPPTPETDSLLVCAAGMPLWSGSKLEKTAGTCAETSFGNVRIRADPKFLHLPRFSLVWVVHISPEAKNSIRQLSLSSPHSPKAPSYKMATTALPPLHNNGDVEKGTATYHNGDSSTLHHNTNTTTGNGIVGHGGGNNNSYTSTQDGGAPFNLRNVTPGGHPLDRVSSLFNFEGRFCCKRKPADMTSSHRRLRTEPTRFPSLPPAVRQPCSVGTVRLRVDHFHALADQR